MVNEHMTYKKRRMKLESNTREKTKSLQNSTMILFNNSQLSAKLKTTMMTAIPIAIVLFPILSKIPSEANIICRVLQKALKALNYTKNSKLFLHIMFGLVIVVVSAY